jgi:hypothetical protein
VDCRQRTDQDPFNARLGRSWLCANSHLNPPQWIRLNAVYVEHLAPEFDTGILPPTRRTMIAGSSAH